MTISVVGRECTVIIDEVTAAFVSRSHQGAVELENRKHPMTSHRHGSLIVTKWHCCVRACSLLHMEDTFEQVFSRRHA